MLEGVVGAGERRRQLGGIGHLFEVGGVVVPLHLRLVGGVYLVLHLLFPVHALEPLMLDDVVGTGLQVSVALGEVRDENLLHQHTTVLVEVFGKKNLARQDALIDAHRILVAERGLADDHLVRQDAWGVLEKVGRYKSLGEGKKSGRVLEKV